MRKSVMRKLDDVVRDMTSVQAAAVIVLGSFCLGAGVRAGGVALDVLKVPSREAVASPATAVARNTVRLDTLEQRVSAIEAQVSRQGVRSDSILAILLWQQCVTRVELKLETKPLTECR
jgi:hypothetical protein